MRRLLLPYRRIRALCICEVDGLRQYRLPRRSRPQSLVKSDRILDPHGLRGLADVFDVALNGNSGVWIHHDQALIAALLGHARTKASVRSQLMQV